MNPILKTSLAYLAPTPAAANSTGICDIAKKTTLATLLLTAATGVNAEELGRLFFSAEQRAQLEYNRQQQDPAPDNARSLTVNGIVQKHGGERTVWINGVPQPAGNSDERAPESVPVAIPGRSQPVEVGQRVIIGPAATGK